MTNYYVFAVANGGARPLAQGGRALAPPMLSWDWDLERGRRRARRVQEKINNGAVSRPDIDRSKIRRLLLPVITRGNDVVPLSSATPERTIATLGQVGHLFKPQVSAKEVNLRTTYTLFYLLFSLIMNQTGKIIHTTSVGHRITI